MPKNEITQEKLTSIMAENRVMELDLENATRRAVRAERVVRDTEKLFQKADEREMVLQDKLERAQAENEHVVDYFKTAKKIDVRILNEAATCLEFAANHTIPECDRSLPSVVDMVATAKEIRTMLERIRK